MDRNGRVAAVAGSLGELVPERELAQQTLVRMVGELGQPPV